jgi:hypothetical protein
MHRPSCSTWLALLLVLVPATTALAGGAQVTISGPHDDGRYRVETLDCGERGDYPVQVRAEGRVNGVRRSLPLRLERTSERGVWSLAPLAERRGDWVLRLTTRRYGHTVSTIAPLDRDGTVRGTTVAFQSDGRLECDRLLGIPGGLAIR